MSAGRVRSFALLVMTMMAAVIATLAFTTPAQAAKKRTVAKCGTLHVAKLKADATRRANRRTSSRTRRSAARRKALRASYLAQSLRRAGCSARTVKNAAPKRTTTTTTTTTAGKVPSRTGSSRPKTGQPTTRQEQTDSITVTPSAVTSQSWWTGMQGGANSWDARVGAKLGAKVVRVEFEIDTTIAAMRDHVADYADRGIRILPLAGFHGRLPSAAEAQNIAAWTSEFGPGGSFWASRPAQAHLAIRHIEFGNETSFSYQGTQKRGGEYAQRVRDAFQAIQAAGNPEVGLLVQADNANQSDNWIAQMYAAVPNIHAYAAGWTVHPYGPRSRWQDRIDEVVTETARRGAPSTMSIDITEWGLSTDNGRCLDDNYGWNKCMTYGEAAYALTGSIDEMRARYGGRIRHFLIYNGRDLRSAGQTSDREHYFGLTTLGEQDKGAFTAAAREVLAAG
jgi:hypothetical protein